MRRYRVELCFSERLKELVRSPAGRSTRMVDFSGRRSIKDLIESMGIPHGEVGFMVRLEDHPIDFNYILRDGDRITLWERIPKQWRESGFSSLRPDPPRPLRFLADVHLGTLARRLRLLGFDTRYRNVSTDRRLAEISQKEQRVLLSRDRGLLMRRQVSHGVLVRGTDPDAQLQGLVVRMGLAGGIRPFTRCLACNGILKPVSAGDKEFARLAKEIPDDIIRLHRRFTFCSRCRRLFWPGSHYPRLIRIINRVLEEQIKGG